VFQFRASVNYEDGRNPAGTAQDMTVRLTDGTGATADALVSTFSGALFYPPGSVFEVPKVVLNTIRIPMSAYGSLNLADIRSIQFRFNQTNSGALLITDLAFADGGTSPGLPDLLETALTDPPAAVTQGGNFSVTDTAENQGVAGAGPSTTRFYASLNMTKGASDVLLTGSRGVPALGVGGSSTGMTMVTVPGSTPVDTYFLLACADDTGTVGESNEANNCRASSTTFQVQAGAGGPDYVITVLADPPAAAALGTKFTVSSETTNQGTTDVLVKTKTQYYLSPDMTKSAGDVLLKGAHKIPALAAGASKSKTRNVKVKLTTPPGLYFLIACADDTQVINEGANEGNNCRTSVTQITIQ
jgi:hypothetical protein